MAILNGIRLAWSANAIKDSFKQASEEYEQMVLQSLQYVGEEFINRARSIDTYTDRTGNLRSSIGYVIYKDGKQLASNFKLSDKGTDRKTGLAKGKEFAGEKARQWPEGFILVGVAGMSYAAAVEANNYDVISGSAPGESDLTSLLKSIITTS